MHAPPCQLQTGKNIKGYVVSICSVVSRMCEV